MARGKGKNWPKLKILAVLKSAHQKFSENALSKLKNSFCEIYYIKQDTLENDMARAAWVRFPDDAKYVPTLISCSFEAL